VIEVEALTGEAIGPALSELARLRIRVFAEWPYLYEGDFAFEEAYLAGFAAAPGAVLVVARDGEAIVGASTASPMAAQSADIRGPVETAGFDPATTCYFGESVLMAGYRGRGLGHAFFDAREDHARSLGLSAAMFAAVIRPEDHPARPENYRALDGFWRTRGYAPVEGLTCRLAWRDHGEAEESAKVLQFWRRALPPGG
jgi:GNAT superfamily N-acetyltransferase